MTPRVPLRWLLPRAVVAMHDALVEAHGGVPGIRDEGLLESTLARPKQLAHYEPERSLFELAATLASGLSSNHPFVDGNKRVALTATAVFLAINGHDLVAPEPETVIVFTDLARGTLDETTLAAWLERHTQPRV